MNTQDYSKLSDEELIDIANKMKTNGRYNRMFFGFLVGVALFSTVKNGLGLMSFLPVVYLPIAGSVNKKDRAIKQLIAERGLELG